MLVLLLLLLLDPPEAAGVQCRSCWSRGKSKLASDNMSPAPNGPAGIPAPWLNPPPLASNVAPAPKPGTLVNDETDDNGAEKVKDDEKVSGKGVGAGSSGSFSRCTCPSSSAVPLAT